MGTNSTETEAPANVENPMIGYLRSLKSSVESAVASTPDIEAPTSAISAGSAWTGTRAKAVHEELAGIAPTLRSCLQSLAGDVQDAMDAVSPKEVTAVEAKVIRIDLYGHN
ncbi:hypothetical protein D9V37_14190 [Nocardioides mangrovicus]|uniref:Uncharacterized protein n=1 Tax=Nocardioides mangrovicus TaxID=2478913 RepID=A0A3L8P0I6_9ACTN|nr:hypothetical protein [Nocardioides mangrovicus]RLV48521.1 hypothetical protein D9V37_14190 [Nocardioides mangrovicus]